MKVTIKTGGLLGEFLPPGSARNSAELDFADESTPHDVLRALGMPIGDGYLISLNGTVVTQDERGSCRLAEGDRLAIMPPLKGG